MSTIQTGSNWWVDSMVRFPGGGYGPSFGPNFRSPMNTIASLATIGEISDPLSGISRDVDNGGTPPQDGSDSNQKIVNTQSQKTAASSDRPSTGDSSTSKDVALLLTNRLEINQPTLQPRRATGTIPLQDENTNSQDPTVADPANDAFKSALIGDMLQNPALAFAAIIPTQDRLGLLSLMGSN